jgi:hypothetical protein
LPNTDDDEENGEYVGYAPHDLVGHARHVVALQFHVMGCGRTQRHNHGQHREREVKPGTTVDLLVNHVHTPW